MKRALLCLVCFLAGCAPAALPAPVSPLPSPVPAVATVAPTETPMVALPTPLPTAQPLGVPLDLPRKLAANGTPVYAAPAADAQQVCVVKEPMHIVAVLEEQGAWSRIRAVGCAGWALSANLRPPF